MTPIRDRHPTLNSEQWADLMAVLPERSLLGLIEAKSIAQDTGALRVMLEGGLFDAAEIQASLDGSDREQIAFETWRGRIGALTHFLTDIAVSTADEDRTHGHVGDFEIALLNATDGMKSFVSDLTARVLDQVAIAKEGHWIMRGIEFHQAMGDLLLTAIGADVPAAVTSLARSHPEAASARLPIQRMGDDIDSNTWKSMDQEALSDHLVTPLGAAFLLSRTACVTAIANEGIDLGSCVAEATREHDSIQFNFDNWNRAFKFRPAPETFELIAETLMGMDKDSRIVPEELFNSTLDTLNNDSDVDNNATYARFLLPILRFDSTKAMMHAAAEGIAAAVDALADEVDWEEVADACGDVNTTPAMIASYHCFDAVGQPADNPEIQASLLAFYNHAERLGHLEAVCSIDVEDDFAPMNKLAMAGLNDALFVYLRAAQLSDDETADFIATIENDVRSETLNAVRAWHARASATSLIQSLDARPGPQP